MKNKSLKTVLLLAMFFIMPFLSKAQELPPDDPIDTIETPIDSWLLVLIGTGALYGVFKMWNGNHPTVK